MASEFERILAALEGVRFVVVGGVAVVLHGHPRVTADLDVVVAVDVTNVRKLLAALSDAEFKPLQPVDPSGLGDAGTRREWREEHGALVLSFASERFPATTLDVFIEPPLDFEAMFERARLVPVGRETVRVASVDDLISMKLGTGRPKDAEDVAALERLRRG